MQRFILAFDAEQGVQGGEIREECGISGSEGVAIEGDIWDTRDIAVVDPPDASRQDRPAEHL
jgi:hypothetical protein